MKTYQKMFFGLAATIALQPAILSMDHEETEEETEVARDQPETVMARLITNLQFQKRIAEHDLQETIPGQLADFQRNCQLATTIAEHSQFRILEAQKTIENHTESLALANQFLQLQKEMEKDTKGSKQQLTASLANMIEKFERMKLNKNISFVRCPVLYNKPLKVTQLTRNRDVTEGDTYEKMLEDKTVERKVVIEEHHRTEVQARLEKHLQEQILLISDAAPLAKGDIQQNDEKTAQMMQNLYTKYRCLVAQEEQLRKLEQGCTVVGSPTPETPAEPAAQKQGGWGWFSKK